MTMLRRSVANRKRSNKGASLERAKIVLQRVNDAKAKLGDLATSNDVNLADIVSDKTTPSMAISQAAAKIMAHNEDILKILDSRSNGAATEAFDRAEAALIVQGDEELAAKRGEFGGAADSATKLRQGREWAKQTLGDMKPDAALDHWAALENPKFGFVQTMPKLARASKTRTKTVQISADQLDGALALLELDKSTDNK